MTERLPALTRRYQNHHLDSTRWDLYTPQAGDVIVTTAYKAGTTWTQLIVLNLLNRDAEQEQNVHEMSPWPDRRIGDAKEVLGAKLAERPPGRPICLKSHVPLDGLPYHREVRYIVVGRDPRDVFMSLFNHYSNYTDAMYERLNGSGERVGDPLPRCPADPRALWRQWITRGWFEWESEGYPFWANMGHTQSYWDFRHLPNLLFVHFNDLAVEPHARIRSIAEFIGVAATDADIDRVVELTRFDRVKRKASALMGHLDTTFVGGADAFFFKGTNGRWRGLLTDEDLELYADAKRRVLSADCARWLEEGGASA